MGNVSSIWHALDDPTRRQILDILREKPRTTGQLAVRFPSTRFAEMKHLTVLEQASLVVVRRKGRERLNHLNAVPLQILYERWVKPYEAAWAQKLTALKSSLEASNPVQSEILTVEMDISIRASKAGCGWTSSQFAGPAAGGERRSDEEAGWKELFEGAFRPFVLGLDH